MQYGADNSVDEIIMSNPFMNRGNMSSSQSRGLLLDEIDRVLKDEGIIYINNQTSNPFTNFSPSELASHGFIAERLDHLAPRFSGLSFTKTDGTTIEHKDMFTLILRRQ